MRALHSAPQSPAADQPRSIRSSAICEVHPGLLPGSGGPQDVDQRSPCPPAHGAQNAQIWTASVVMGIEPTPAQIGGAAPRASGVSQNLPRGPAPPPAPPRPSMYYDAPRP